ncbi:MAG: hypothetical protein O3A36_00220 [bacterium]|nr:hypothetical protein [bacterium]
MTLNQYLRITSVAMPIFAAAYIAFYFASKLLSVPGPRRGDVIGYIISDTAIFVIPFVLGGLSLRLAAGLSQSSSTLQNSYLNPKVRKTAILTLAAYTALSIGLATVIPLEQMDWKTLSYGPMGPAAPLIFAGILFFWFFGQIITLIAWSIIRTKIRKNAPEDSWLRLSFITLNILHIVGILSIVFYFILAIGEGLF